MEIRWDAARQDYRVRVNRNDADAMYAISSQRFPENEERHFSRHLLDIGTHANLSLRNRAAFTGALLRMIAYMYGEDISDNPNLPTLARKRFNEGLTALREMKTTPHDPETPHALVELANEHNAQQQRDERPKRIDELYGDL